MADEVLLQKGEDRIAIITLNRANALHAIDRAMVRALRRAVADVESDHAVDVAIVTGAGEKAFCVGVDLKERQTLSDDEAEQFRLHELFPMYRELDERQKPSIAVVHGHCLGGGFELALSCDLVIATPAARFALPEVRWGLIPAAGGCQKVPRLAGMQRAKELILCGRTLTAEEAERWGLVNRVVPEAERMEVARDLARQVLANVQVAVRGAKRCIDHGAHLARARAYDIEVSNVCYAAKERKGGLTSFANRKAESPRSEPGAPASTCAWRPPRASPRSRRRRS